MHYIHQSKPRDWRVILTKLYFLQAYFKINVDIFLKKGGLGDCKRTPYLDKRTCKFVCKGTPCLNCICAHWLNTATTLSRMCVETTWMYCNVSVHENNIWALKHGVSDSRMLTTPELHRNPQTSKLKHQKKLVCFIQPRKRSVHIIQWWDVLTLRQSVFHTARCVSELSCSSETITELVF